MCIEAGTVHKIPCGDFIGIAPANAKRELSIRQNRDAENRRIEQHGAAEILQFVSEGRHIAMAVEEAGFCRHQRRGACELGLQCDRFAGLKHGQPLYIIAAALLEEALEFPDLVGIRRDNHLAGAPVGDTVGGEIGVELSAA